MQNAPTPPDDFEPWETKAIEIVVTKFLRTRKLPVHIAAEDLIQESAGHWARQRRAYNPVAGATKRTFLDRVVNHKLISLEREWKAVMRGGGNQHLSLDRPISDEPGASTLGDLLEARRDSSSDLHVDMQRAFKGLTPRQRLIVKGLGERRTVSEIARLVGVHKDTVNEEVKRIRDVLTDAGLRQYLS